MKKTCRNVMTVLLATLITMLPLPVLASEHPPDGYTFNIPGNGESYVLDKNGNLVPAGEKSQTAQTPATSSALAASEAPATAQPNALDSSEYAAEVLRLVNLEREKAGLPALKTDPVLTQMAEKRAEEMVISYSHIRPNGERARTIFDEYDTDLIFGGENGALNATPAEVMEAWMNSEGHRANILRENVEYLGVGFVQKPNSARYYWVQLFAR